MDAEQAADCFDHRLPQRGCLLLEWIRQADQDAPKPMKDFASFLRQDLNAVTAGLTLPWSSGVVEAHVNRIKTLKLAICDRASFELLRTRILTQPRLEAQVEAGLSGPRPWHSGDPPDCRTWMELLEAQFLP